MQKSVVTWSIPRTERFKVNKLNCDNIYNVPAGRSKRGTSQGYGHKLDLMPQNISPSPSAYNIKSLFEKNSDHKKGVIVAQKLNTFV